MGRTHDEHDADRRHFLKCMAWVGTGAVWTLSSGVLKGSALNSLLAAALLAAALVPLGIAAWRAAPPVSRTAWRGGWVAVAALAGLYAYHLLVEL